MFSRKILVDFSNIFVLFLLQKPSSFTLVYSVFFISKSLFTFQNFSYYFSPLHNHSTTTLQQPHNHSTTTTQPLHNNHTTTPQQPHNHSTTTTQPLYNNHTITPQQPHNNHTTTPQPLHSQSTTTPSNVNIMPSFFTSSHFVSSFYFYFSMFSI